MRTILLAVMMFGLVITFDADKVNSGIGEFETVIVNMTNITSFKISWLFIFTFLIDVWKAL